MERRCSIPGACDLWLSLSTPGSMRGHVLENRVESYKGRHLMSASGFYMHTHTYTVQHINIQITHMGAKHGVVGLDSQWGR